MPEVSAVVLDLLGLSKTVASVKNVVSATKEGVAAINAVKELLDSEPGRKFKAQMIEIISGSTVTPQGEVHIDVKKSFIPAQAVGRWEWDGFKGWVWKPD